MLDEHNVEDEPRYPDQPVRTEDSPSQEAARATGRFPLQPNMLCLNADVTSSTFSSLSSAHSLIAGSSYFNSVFHRSNFESAAFHACDFDGAVIENSSLRGVELRNCDVEGLIIDGIRVGILLKLMIARGGR
jgi:uncharacterized protein YjbI with pentapeptide repeats